MFNTNGLLAAGWFEPRQHGGARGNVWASHSTGWKRSKKCIKRSETRCFSLFILKYPEGPRDIKQNNPAEAKRHSWKGQKDGGERAWWRTSEYSTHSSGLLVDLHVKPERETKTGLIFKEKHTETWIWWKTSVQNQSAPTKKKTDERKDRRMVSRYPQQQQQQESGPQTGRKHMRRDGWMSSRQTEAGRQQDVRARFASSRMAGEASPRPRYH